jgi:hypothetical protein
MIEKFEPALWEHMSGFANDPNCCFGLGDYLKSIGDPRSQDVYEVGILECPADIGDGERVAFRLARRPWCELYRLANHVMGRLLPGTAQRERAERYGGTHYSAPFLTKGAERERLERKYSDPAGVAAWLDMVDQSRRKRKVFAESIGKDEERALIGEEEIEASYAEQAFDECRASLVLMQFGTTAEELRGRATILGVGHRVESIEEYQAFVEGGQYMGCDPYTCLEDAIESAAGSHHLPQWMAELRRVNAGGFEWVMNFLVEHEEQYPGVVARVQEVVPYTPRRKKTPKRPRGKK